MLGLRHREQGPIGMRCLPRYTQMGSRRMMMPDAQLMSMRFARGPREA